LTELVRVVLGLVYCQCQLYRMVFHRIERLWY